jgi:hypothetical protein
MWHRGTIQKCPFKIILIQLTVFKKDSRSVNQVGNQAVTSYYKKEKAKKNYLRRFYML